MSTGIKCDVLESVKLFIHYTCHKFLSCQLQQIEEAQLQQREANLTALAAIGPRRKRPLEQTESQVGVCVRCHFCV